MPGLALFVDLTRCMQARIGFSKALIVAHVQEGFAVEFICLKVPESLIMSRRSEKKSGQESASQQWLYGIHAVQTLLKTAAGRVIEIRVQNNRRDQRLNKICKLAEIQAVDIQLVAREELDKLVSGNHQGVVALAHGGEIRDEKFVLDLLDNLQQIPLLLVLDGITDPHNLGACLRSADAAGVHAVIAPKDRSVGITPVVQKVACGAAETVPYVVVTNIARTLRKLQDRGVWLVGTAGLAEHSLYETDLKVPTALVMGAEGSGLRRLTQESCDVLVKLPMTGSVESLNVSVATGICLFEAVRQRQS